MTVPATLIRWLSLSSMALVVGTLALDVLALPRDAPERALARARLRRWLLLGVLALALAWGGELIVRAQTMSGGDLATAIRAVPTVLRRTHFGAIWAARAGLIVVLFAIAFVSTGAARAIGVILAIGLALSTSLTGHAADRGDVSVAVLVDWAHVLAAMTWAGGLLGLVVAVLGTEPTWSPPALAATLRRFSRLAAFCLLLVVLTGSYTAWTQLSDISNFWTTAYGRTLAVKLTLVLLLVWLGATNRYVLLPRVMRQRPCGRVARAFRLTRLVLGPRVRMPRVPPLAALSRSVRGEITLALVVFGATAVLGELTPARHAAHLASAGISPDGASTRVTMQELHRGPGVPPGWMFTPPSGDAARGRAVFERHRCFDCHPVSGERFPVPSRPGPDLTGIGDHHPPGYLAESVLNPDAIVVDGPGYAAPDGSSTMPRYPELTLGELADLVAYLQRLGGEHHHTSR